MSDKSRRFANQAMVTGEVLSQEERSFEKPEGGKGTLLSVTVQQPGGGCVNITYREEHVSFIKGLINPGDRITCRGTLKQREFDGRKFVSVNAMPPHNPANFRKLGSGEGKPGAVATLVGSVPHVVSPDDGTSAEADLEVPSLNPRTQEEVMQRFTLTIEADDVQAFERLVENRGQVEVKCRIRSEVDVDDYGGAESSSKINVEQYRELAAKVEDSEEA